MAGKGRKSEWVGLVGPQQPPRGVAAARLLSAPGVWGAASQTRVTENTPWLYTGAVQPLKGSGTQSEPIPIVSRAAGGV